MKCFWNILQPSCKHLIQGFTSNLMFLSTEPGQQQKCLNIQIRMDFTVFAFTNIIVDFTCFLCLVELGLVVCCYSSWPCSQDVAWSVPNGEKGKHGVCKQLCITSTGNAGLSERLSLVCKILTLTPPSWFFGRGPPGKSMWSGLHSKYRNRRNTMVLLIN